MNPFPKSKHAPLFSRRMHVPSSRTRLNGPARPNEEAQKTIFGSRRTLGYYTSEPFWLTSVRGRQRQTRPSNGLHRVSSLCSGTTCVASGSKKLEEASELTTFDILKRCMPDGRLYYMLHVKPSKYDRARVVPIGMVSDVC